MLTHTVHVVDANGRRQEPSPLAACVEAQQ